MEESRKELRFDASGEVSGKKERTPTASDGDADDDGDSDDDIMAWLSIGEDTVGELMELLEPELSSPIKVKFIDNPYVTPLIFQSSASYVTINGNEETCGSSFSDSDASIMASIDMGGVKVQSVSSWAGGFTAASEVGWCTEEGSWKGNGEGLSDWDGFDWDDNVLARFLGEDLF